MVDGTGLQWWLAWRRDLTPMHRVARALSNCQKLWLRLFHLVRVGVYRMWDSPPSTGSVMPVM
jgi:hypothetical protein